MRKTIIFIIMTVLFAGNFVNASEYAFPVETTELNEEICVGIYKGGTSLRKDSIRLMIEGEYEKSLEAVNKIAGRSGFGPVALYKKAMYYAFTDEPESSWREAASALNKGAPVELFMAGPRSMFGNLYSHSEFKKAVEGKMIIHGPMLGAVTDSSAKVWIRTWDEKKFRIIFSESQDMSNQIVSSEAMTKKEDDFTGVAEVKGLKPGTKYYYKVMPEGINTEKIYSFRTYPPEGRPGKFDVAFGACSNLDPSDMNEPIWKTILSRNPEAFIQLGDNTYIDDPTGYEHQRANYYIRHSIPQYRELMAATSNYAVWDDHDFSVNDGVSSCLPDKPPWKKKVLEIWKQNFIAPYYGGGEANPGVYTHFSIADVDFFLLDTRYNRENPLTIFKPTMLGPVQKKWLFDNLKNSNAKFKIIATSVPFALEIAGKEMSKDTWDGYQEEKLEIYDFIRKNNITGVVSITGDRHRADARIIHIDGNYGIYEFLNARLTNDKGIPLVEDGPDSEFLFGYNSRKHYGMLSFDTTKNDPELTYTIINEQDQDCGSVTVRYSQLINPGSEDENISEEEQKAVKTGLLQQKNQEAQDQTMTDEETQKNTMEDIIKKIEKEYSDNSAQGSSGIMVTVEKEKNEKTDEVTAEPIENEKTEEKNSDVDTDENKHVISETPEKKGQKQNKITAKTETAQKKNPGIIAAVFSAVFAALLITVVIKTKKDMH